VRPLIFYFPTHLKGRGGNIHRVRNGLAGVMLMRADFRKNVYRVLGVALGLAGFVVFLQAVPTWVWLASLGVLLVLIGWALYRRFDY